jgi:hypothetical protein
LKRFVFDFFGCNPPAGLQCTSPETASAAIPISKIKGGKVSGEPCGGVHGDKNYAEKEILSTKRFITISRRWSILPYKAATGGHFCAVLLIDIFCRKSILQKCI